jgi:Spy/CpxP family protein refolding chaperone
MTHVRDLHLTEDEMNKIQDIRSEFRPRIEKAVESLKGILTDEQRETREQGLKAGKSHVDIMRSLNLSDAQKEKIATACKEACTAVREELEKVNDALTPEQQAQLTEFKDERADRVRDRWAHRVANMKELNLTDEQKTKIENIRKEFRPRVHEAVNRLRATVRQEGSMIRNVLKS